MGRFDGGGDGAVVSRVMGERLKSFEIYLTLSTTNGEDNTNVSIPIPCMTDQ